MTWKNVVYNLIVSRDASLMGLLQKAYPCQLFFFLYILLQPSLMQFFISKQWINRFNTFAEPGPITNDDFLCPHGGMFQFFLNSYYFFYGLEIFNHFNVTERKQQSHLSLNRCLPLLIDCCQCSLTCFCSAGCSARLKFLKVLSFLMK